VKKEPNNIFCLSGMVSHHLLEGDVTEAAKVTGQLAAVVPASPETMLAQGRVQAAKGDYSAALKYFETACDMAHQEAACFRADALRQEGW
jgi:Flp pilus assembly protein TadD